MGYGAEGEEGKGGWGGSRGTVQKMGGWKRLVLV